MKKTIDCFFIGHNEMDFVEYEKNIRHMGVNSGAYRDLNLSFIRCSETPYTAAGFFNFLHSQAQHQYRSKHAVKPLNMYETLSPAIAYLGTYLHRRGLTFDYVNTFNDRKEVLAEKLVEENIRTIAIITTLYVSVYPILEIVDVIKRYNHSARLIVGGPFMATQIRSLGMNTDEIDYLFHAVDADFYVNSSQGEAALVDIINALKHDSPPDQIKNIIFKRGNTYIPTEMEREDNPLEQNMVDWRLFSHSVGTHAAIRTSISCPFACAFCGFPEHAGKYQTADPAAVEMELNQLEGPGNESVPVSHISFIDDTFNVPVQRFKDILKMMIKNNFQSKFKWNAHFRCQFADREMVELMKESGCEGVFLGIESGNDRMLKNMNKAANVEKYVKGMALLKEYGIITYGSFIIGFPGETEKTVKDTVTFIKESGLDFFRAQLWYAEPITPIWREKEAYGIRGSNFEWRHDTMDSRKAADLVDDIFLSINTPTWVPQYNFEIYSIFQLLHRGFSLGRVKSFLKGFNHAIKEKIRNPNPGQEDVSAEMMRQLKRTCPGIEPPGKGNDRVKDESENIEKSLDLLEDIHSIEVELDI
jgi:radical SAM PhpK family P-methyltransferase